MVAFKYEPPKRFVERDRSGGYDVLAAALRERFIGKQGYVAPERGFDLSLYRELGKGGSRGVPYDLCRSGGGSYGKSGGSSPPAGGGRVIRT